MSGRTHTLVKAHAAGAAVLPHRLVKFDGNGAVIQAAAAADVAIGASGPVGAAAAGKTLDVVHGGAAEVVYGGNVAAGARVTANASGQAVATTTAGNAVAGIALTGGVAGDVGTILLTPGAMVAAAGG